jgi:hypothetical protein
MSTDNQSKLKLEDLLVPVEDLLGRLSETSLRRSHESVLISFEQMLAYTDKISTSGMPAEIKLLLDTYHDMAESFYTQYETTLLEEIRNQRSTRENADSVLVLLDKMKARIGEVKILEAMETAKQLLNTREESARLEYNDLIKNFPCLLQNALDKLREEWQRIHGIAIASQAITRGENSKKDGELIRALEVALESAAYTIGIEAERIVIVPGNAFALYFFSYLDNFAILTVPIYSVQAPWEWSIFWHELAGYKVRQLENDSIINDVKNGLMSLYDQYQKLTNPADRSKLLESITRMKQDDTNESTNPFSGNYLKGILSDDELDISDLGGFEHQFERMLANLPKKNKFQMYEQLKKDGWCVDWFKELFEDAWSVLTFRWDFLIFFDDILSRHSARDDRHPPIEIRLKVASLLLDLEYPAGDDSERANILNKIVLSPDEEVFTRIAAKQILKFKSLIVSARYTLNSAENTIAQSQTQEVGTPEARREVLERIHVSVMNMITNSTLNWSNKLDGNDSQVGEATSFADETLGEFMRLLTLKKTPEASYGKLLKGKDFRELLGLSFFERDFLNSNKIKNVRLSFGVKATTPFTVVSETVNFILPSNVIVPGDGGDISFDIDGLTYHTSKLNWNEAFNLHPEYKIQ